MTKEKKLKKYMNKKERNIIKLRLKFNDLMTSESVLQPLSLNKIYVNGFIQMRNLFSISPWALSRYCGFSNFVFMRYADCYQHLAIISAKNNVKSYLTEKHVSKKNRNHMK